MDCCKIVAIMLLVAIAGVGCRLRNFEQEDAPLLLPGYSEFKSEGGEPATGRYSYRIPAAMKPEEVIPAATSRLKSLRPCYEAIRESAFSAVLRCQHSDRSQRFNEIQEFGFRMVAKKGRLYVLQITDVPADPQRHERLLGDLEEIANR
jgi:hypothetical protein